MQSKAQSVEEYLASLPEDRRQALVAVRRVILDNLPEGYQETMNWGMISYEVPLSMYPDTYNKQPLLYAALASQKNHMALYMTGLYYDGLEKDFAREYTATGKKLDMGKSCIRFKVLDDLPLEVIGKYIAAVRLEVHVGNAKAAQTQRKS